MRICDRIYITHVCFHLLRSNAMLDFYMHMHAMRVCHNIIVSSTGCTQRRIEYVAISRKRIFIDACMMEQRSCKKKICTIRNLVIMYVRFKFNVILNILH